MPISSRFGYNSFKVTGTGEQDTPFSMTVTPSITGTNSDVATYTITSNRPNATIYYSIVGASNDDFNSGTITGNVTLDTDGNTTINLTANTSPLTSSNTLVADKSFNMEIYNYVTSSNVLASSSNLNLNANVFVTAEGGIETTTSGPNPDTVYKFHEFYSNTSNTGFILTTIGTIGQSNVSRQYVNYLSVGGGGTGYNSSSISNVHAGGSPAGGGGGGVTQGVLTDAPEQTYNVNVGIGGGVESKDNSNPTETQRNQDGYNTEITGGNISITALGGKKATHTGSSIGSNNAFGDTGGDSGNGNLGNMSIRYSPLGTPVSNFYRGGGGGGGGAGQKAGVVTVGPPGKGADGGAGAIWVDGNYYGGGGGGAAPYNQPPQNVGNVLVYVGAGGIGGGGRGGLNYLFDDSEPGEFGTGGGGGGGQGGPINSISPGGDGVVKFRYEWKAPIRTLNS